MALANLLDDGKDEQVLKEACLGLCQLFGEGIQNDRIQAILEANVVPKLVALLRPSKSRSVPISVQSAALQVLGNVACGDDRQTQVVIDSDALPCLRALLSSSDRGIRKEVCWIVSNITESSHQVQDVLDADILPPLLKLLDNQDTACREDATWVLFNLSSNRDPSQIAYLAEKNGVRALCNLLSCPKDLDVLWKGCGTVAAVALKGLRNILISGHLAAASDPNGYNKMASLVAEAHGVERIEALTNHDSPDVRNRARLILERMFGTEPTSGDHCNISLSAPSTAGMTSMSTPPPPPPMGHAGCSCAFQQHQQHSGTHYQSNGLYDISSTITSHAISSPHFAHSIGAEHSLPSHLHPDGDLIDVPGSSSGSSTDSDPEDDDSDSDLIPPPPAPCTCVLCSDSSPLVERRPRGKGAEEAEAYKHDGYGVEVKQICDFCSGSGRLGDGRAGLAAKLGRAVRLGHSHCLAILLSRMTWSQRVAATEAPALLHPGGGPPDGGVGNTLPALVLAAQLGKPDCLALLLRKCRPDLDARHGKKRLTALAWAAHKSYVRCCQLLIDFGANTATKCGDGVTALHLAASGGGHPVICKLLIDHNAPVNARSSKKQTPLCLAAQKGAMKVVHLLLEYGADANNEDDGKYTPLHLAASKGFEHCVDLLLKAGARVDSFTRKGVTPLHYAVQGGFAAVVRLLIAAGAKVNCNHKPLLLIAADDGNVEVVHILLDAQAAIDCKANIRAMLDKETEVSDYLTPLHLAASKAHQEVVELLLSRGANVNEVTTKRGWSALDFAVLNGHAECAVTLLEHGAVVTDNCKSIGRNNWTLVQYAAHHGAKDVVRLLVQRLQEQRTGISHVSSVRPGGPFDLSSASNVRAFEDVEDVNGIYKTHANVDGECTHVDYLGEDDECDHIHDSCQHHHEDMGHASQPAHRYDPRSLEGDEVGFGTGPGYGITAGTPETSSKSRRRVVKEDRQSSIRAREMRKRESEANEARDRLEEAINQRSITKLTEAIAHVSKLVLHLATTAENDVNGTVGQADHVDANGYDAYNNGGHVHSVAVGQAKGSSSPCNSNGFSSPIAIEVGLGNEVQRARKILASLVAEEKRIREEKEREAADSKRENAQASVKKAISAALQGGDSRSLTRAITRATRTILDGDEAIILEASAILDIITSLEKSHNKIKVAIRERDLESLSDSLPKAAELLSELMKQEGDGAVQRIFGETEPTKVLADGEKLQKDLQEKRQRAIQEEQRAKDLEKNAKDKLEGAMKSNNIVALEKAVKEAAGVLLSKESELGSTIESAKKVLTKLVKGERRKLRQACNTNDPEKIEKTANSVAELGLQSLQSDIDSARTHAQKLREQVEAVAELDTAISESDIVALNDIREKLTKLGMFAEAEKARAEVERLQKARRARTLLQGSIDDAKNCRDEAASALAEGKTASDALESFSSWSWPDAQRLHELSERARIHGQSSHSLCSTAESLLKELSKLGRRVLMLCTKSDDAQAIAAMIAGYEKSFMSVSKPEIFDLSASEKAIAEAQKRLADVQAMDQASVKAESAQVKVEYALATSRRTAARNRGTKSGGGGRSHTKPTSVQKINSPKTGERSGASTSEVQSHSSVSSEYGDEDSSETETGTQQLQSVETGSAKSSEGYRPSVPKKSRPATYLTDDSGFGELGPELSSALAGECSHFYLYKEGSTVLCVRCGHLRSSGNPEWLARVKRRGSKVPPELMNSPFSPSTCGVEMGPSGLRNSGSVRSLNDISSGDRNDVRYGRGAMGRGLQQPMSSAFGMGGLGGMTRGVSGLGLNRETGHTTSLAMMMPMLNGPMAGQNVPKLGGNGRGRGRSHMGIGGSGLESGLQGIGHGIYGSNAVSGQHGSVVSTSMGGGYGGNASGTLGEIGSRMPGPQSGVGGYGMSGLGGLDSTKNGIQIGNDVGTINGRAMGVNDMLTPGGGRGMSGVGVVGTTGEDGTVGGLDLGIMDFENENFGFDIDKIVDDNPLPGSESSMSNDIGRDSLGRVGNRNVIGSSNVRENSSDGGTGAGVASSAGNLSSTNEGRYTR